MSEQLIKCPQCGAPVDAKVSSCKFCGASINTQQPQYQQPQQPQYQQPQQPQYQQPQQPQYQQPQYQQPQQFVQPIYDHKKNKAVAGLLGIFLGGLGIHKFYLGRVGTGILYLLFAWTFIPAAVGFIEGIIYLATSEDTFRAKYCKRLN